MVVFFHKRKKSVFNHSRRFIQLLANVVTPSLAVVPLSSTLCGVSQNANECENGPLEIAGGGIVAYAQSRSRNRSGKRNCCSRSSLSKSQSASGSVSRRSAMSSSNSYSSTSSGSRSSFRSSSSLCSSSKYDESTRSLDPSCSSKSSDYGSRRYKSYSSSRTSSGTNSKNSLSYCGSSKFSIPKSSGFSVSRSVTSSKSTRSSFSSGNALSKSVQDAIKNATSSAQTTTPQQPVEQPVEQQQPDATQQGTPPKIDATVDDLMRYLEYAQAATALPQTMGQNPYGFDPFQSVLQQFLPQINSFPAGGMPGQCPYGYGAAGAAPVVNNPYANFTTVTGLPQCPNGLPQNPNTVVPPPTAGYNISPPVPPTCPAGHHGVQFTNPPPSAPLSPTFHNGLYPNIPAPLSPTSQPVNNGLNFVIPASTATAPGAATVHNAFNAANQATASPWSPGNVFTSPQPILKCPMKSVNAFPAHGNGLATVFHNGPPTPLGSKNLQQSQPNATTTNPFSTHFVAPSCRYKKKRCFRKRLTPAQIHKVARQLKLAMI